MSRGWRRSSTPTSLHRRAVWICSTSQQRARAIAAAALEAGVGRVCLNHGDFRTGNLLVQAGRLSGVLDWEFAGYRPEEADVGWMLSSPWRYGRPDLDASGLMAREALLDALGQAATRPVGGLGGLGSGALGGHRPAAGSAPAGPGWHQR